MAIPSTGTTAAPSVGNTTAQGLSDWSAPYITGYLGKSQALGEQPYQVYGGPLTAGASELQNKVFQGLGSLNFPTNLNQQYTADSSQQYMNPYLMQVINPQLQEVRRASQINLQPQLAELTKAGGLGGGRQAIMESEANRNLLNTQSNILGQGLASAYDKGLAQFNLEKGRAADLVNMMAQQGATQRGIESEGVAADLAEFNQQRQYPYQQVQFLRDMISGLPTASIATTQNAPQGIAALATAAGGLDKLLSMSKGDTGLGNLLKNLGFTSET